MLTPYAFGINGVNLCSDDEYYELVEKNDIYGSMPPSKVIQKFIKNVAYTSNFRHCVISAAKNNEREQKKNFVLKNYPMIKEEDIYFVSSSSMKLTVLRAISDKYRVNSERIVMVDDTVSLLSDIQRESNFKTLHVSSFLYM